ncbi:hypothetical protein, partial [Thiolapillus sp.]|uniref:hypothetical protein n=1 Tax=Thiolapillus sp. TaxID=2017437 RepID=UPI003AF4D19A
SNLRKSLCKNTLCHHLSMMTLSKYHIAPENSTITLGSQPILGAFAANFDHNHSVLRFRLGGRGR